MWVTAAVGFLFDVGGGMQSLILASGASSAFSCIFMVSEAALLLCTCTLMTCCEFFSAR